MNDLEDYFATLSIPAPLAAFSHQRRRAEEVARQAIAASPPLDVNLLRAAAKSYSPAARAALKPS